jgi:hypothetical protein
MTINCWFRNDFIFIVIQSVWNILQLQRDIDGACNQLLMKVKVKLLLCFNWEPLHESCPGSYLVTVNQIYNFVNNTLCTVTGFCSLSLQCHCHAMELLFSAISYGDLSEKNTTSEAHVIFRAVRTIRLSSIVNSISFKLYFGF